LQDKKVAGALANISLRRSRYCLHHNCSNYHRPRAG